MLFTEDWTPLSESHPEPRRVSERRRYARIDLVVPVSFERKGPGATLKGKGTTRNISPTGLYLSLPVLLGVGEKVSVTLHLPKKGDITFESRVKWVKTLNPTSHEVGMEISDITVEDQNHYLLFVCNLMYDSLKDLQMFK